MVTYRFKDIVKGNKFKGRTFKLKLNDAYPDITNVRIEMWMRRGSKTGNVVKVFDTDDTGFTKSDPTNAVFQLDPFIMDVPVDTYYLDMKFTFPGNDPQTYMEASWNVKQNVTGN